MQFNQPYIVLREFLPLTHHFTVCIKTITEFCVVQYAWDGKYADKLETLWTPNPKITGVEEVSNELLKFKNWAVRDVKNRFGNEPKVYYDGFYSEAKIQAFVIEKERKVSYVEITIKLFPSPKEATPGFPILYEVYQVKEISHSKCKVESLCTFPNVLDYFVPGDKGTRKTFIVDDDNEIDPKLMDIIREQKAIPIEAFNQKNNLVPDVSLSELFESHHTVSKELIEISDMSSEIEEALENATSAPIIATTAPKSSGCIII